MPLLRVFLIRPLLVAIESQDGPQATQVRVSQQVRDQALRRALRKTTLVNFNVDSPEGMRQLTNLGEKRHARRELIRRAETSGRW